MTKKTSKQPMKIKHTLRTDVMQFDLFDSVSGNNKQSGGQFELFVEKQVAGKMTYYLNEVGQMVINHTIVDKAHAGKGFAQGLLMAGVAHARENGLKIVPECTFVEMMFQRYAEIDDVLAQ